MKIPQKPPDYSTLLMKMVGDPTKLAKIAAVRTGQLSTDEYLHWDKVRHLPTPDGMTHELWWLGIKMARSGMLRSVPLRDTQGREFSFCVPEVVQAALHEIDIGAGGAIGLPEPITNPQTKNQYLVRSLMEEAITSSQLEGAVTTREVAKEMIRTGRPPRDTSEQMILNNYSTMQRITELKAESLTPDIVLNVHRLVTEKTLDKPDAAGRLRNPDEPCVIADAYGEIFHTPPPAVELGQRMAAMCDFANGLTPAGTFVHPVVRAIILHFWLAYDHPFVDGNGRTARALFYWSMLHQNCWLFEFISISSILRRAPAEYARSYLYTETDDNDLTYFIVAQTKVIRRAIAELHAYIDRKTAEVLELESHVRALNLFNYRQAEVIRHALKHPSQQYTIGTHRASHGVVYQTARADLLNLKDRGILEQSKRGRQMVFIIPKDLSARLKKLERQSRS